MNDANFELFDIIKYLQSRNIHYDPEGKNVSDGWIGIKCLWPGCADTSNHLGINLTAKTISCWVCGKKGSLLNLILLIDSCTVKQAFKTIKKFSYADILTDRKKSLTEHHKTSINDFQLPSEAKNELFDLHRDYLTNRGLDAEYVFNKYKLKSIGPVGKYCNRILIPYYYQNKLMTFSTRDATGQTNTYIHCPKELSPSSPKKMLYNFDTVKDTIVIVEGAFVVFKLGDGVVATSGSQWTMLQVYLCHLLTLKRVFILFDAEIKAQEQAVRLASALSCLIDHVEILSLAEGDLDNLTNNEVVSFRKEIFGKIF